MRCGTWVGDGFGMGSSGVRGIEWEGPLAPEDRATDTRPRTRHLELAMASAEKRSIIAFYGSLEATNCRLFMIIHD